MKPISSAITGIANPEQRGASSTGSERGGTGYAARPPRSYGLDHEPTEVPEHSVPAKARATAPQLANAAFLMPSPMPETKPIVLVSRGGKTRMALALVNPSDLSTLRAQIDSIRQELEPVDPREVSVEIVKLLAHYPQTGPTDQKLAISVAEDWLEDMANVSAKGFRAAVTSWRRSTQRFRPSPGQLLAVIEELEGPLRRALASRLELEHVETNATDEPQQEI